MAVINGTVNEFGEITGTITANLTISGKLEHPPLPDAYEGAYEVTPSGVEQTLQTDAMYMSDNVVVHAIPPEFVDVSDTTATPSTVKAGEIFHTADGARAVGEMEGLPSNIVFGTFHTPSEAGAFYHDIPYSGAGYPIQGWIHSRHGADPAYFIDRATIHAVFSKDDPHTAPSYNNSADGSSTCHRAFHYRSAGTYRNSQSTGIWRLFSQFTGNYDVLPIAFPSAAKFAIWVATNGDNCFAPDTDYDYVIVYSE